MATPPEMADSDPIHHLPLPLLRSHTVPPAPNRPDPPGSAIDWLPTFSGLSWIAYGASSLLVVSHFPSPLSPGETAAGPIFRQVFELSGEPVNAVSWSPASPCVGGLAAAAGNCVRLFAHDSATTKGSFCWSQNATLVQSTKVEALGWTGSGDGIVSGGVEVVLWRRNNRFWEIAWKLSTELPQTLVSATWSVDGPFATSAYSSATQVAVSCCNEERKRVCVYQNDGRSECGKTELNHPLPVSMIQWRPPKRLQSDGDGKYSVRNFLLTCCLDGTVRLWSEIDSGRARRNSKDGNEQKTMRRSFCVAAVIEVNQSIGGILGMDVFLTWATEIEGLSATSEGMKKFSSSKLGDFEKAGSCEWIIGFGPEMAISFWAIHCLDDVSPMRFPRVKLWKTLKLYDIETGRLCGKNLQISGEKIFLSNAPILRNSVSSAPTLCSLIQLTPSNSLVWSPLYPQSSSNIEDSAITKESASIRFLNLDGHTGKILQVAVHPYSCEVDMAVSLDSNGFLLFWSLSSVYNCIIGRPTLIPAWEIFGKLGTKESFSIYTSLRWAPSMMGDQELFLLVGHVGGIDCFIVKKFPAEDENIECHYLCTIPFTGHGPFEEGPSEIFSVPLPSTGNEILHSRKFLLLGVWLNGFQAVSWEVTLHSYDLSGDRCSCGFEAMNATFSGKRYCINARPCSSQFPEPHKHDHVTSFVVVDPHTLVSQTSASLSAYTMATGCRNGYLKLWRSKLGETPWELVGMLKAHQGPISLLRSSHHGHKIATTCKETYSNTANSLSIWKSVRIEGLGVFVLEDTITLDEPAAALNWLALNNGQLLLGICTRNKLQIYAQGCLLYSGQFPKEKIWHCIAFSRTFLPINDFTWGQRATIIAVHDRFLSVMSQWLFLDSGGEKEKNLPATFFTDGDVGGLTDLSLEDGKNLKRGRLSHWNMLDVVQKFNGTMQVYNAEALLMNIFTGNWKRSYAAVKHLIESLTKASEKTNSTVISSCIIPQIPLSNYFEGAQPNSIPDKGFSPFAYTYELDFSNNFESSSSKKSELPSFIERLEKFDNLTGLTSEEKIRILSVIDLLSEITNPNSAYGSLDEPGQRFWVALKYKQLHFMRKFGKSATLDELDIDSSLFVWAYHSDCEENLFGSVLPNESTWPDMRKLGVGFWFTNVSQLRSKMEKLARNQYLKNKNPRDCALLYVALNRIQVLAGLFKISKDERDKPLVGFLVRNFKEEKNKAAALKNAYVLLGKHQLELAIAFFLLGGDVASAINVCAKTLGDGQLALVICRLIEGLGGPSEQHLIAKIMLPNAIEKGNIWLASLLEWELGNYYQSFMRMFGFRNVSGSKDSMICFRNVSFMEPNIGLYCLTLTSKTSMRNAVGDENSTILLEALERLSSSPGVLGIMKQGNLSNFENLNVLDEVLKPSMKDSSNWISENVASDLDNHYKLDTALIYFSKLIKEHPSWKEIAFKPSALGRYENRQYSLLLESFHEKFYAELHQFEQRFSILPLSLISKILILLHNNGLLFVGYDLLCGYTNRIQSRDKIQTYDFISKPLLKVTEETSLLLSRFIATCSFVENNACYESDSSESYSMGYYSESILLPLRILRASLRVTHGSASEEPIEKPLTILDLIEYVICFAYSWFQRDNKALFQAVKPLLLTDVPQISSQDDTGEIQISKFLSENGGSNTKQSIPEDERSRIIGVCLWQHVLIYLKNKLNSVGSFHGGLPSGSSSADQEFDENISNELIDLISLTLLNSLETTIERVSSNHVKQLASYLHAKMEDEWPTKTLVWLEEFVRSQRDASEIPVHSSVHRDTVDEKDGYDSLWDICADRKIILESFAAENINFSTFFHHKPSKGWREVYDGMQYSDEADNIHNSKELIENKIVSFLSPKEVLKTNGELLEALCINSTKQGQAAVASNRKGILFFNWEDTNSSTNESDYIWSNADWPSNGWAGSESTPALTRVSPGIGLGSEKGAHLGLGGATVGPTKPIRDFTGGAAFGIPGYAGMGASGLGWETQEEFEEVVDTLPSVGNISTRAFSSHPFKPIFLAASSNTHIYLWEFGKDKACATYGVLPAANVPPPYALASISALQFDHYGQRFASSAVDGTVCTWQLEVGGRSNIRPTQASHCFDSHASDVAYISSSGSIIVVAGHSVNGVNAVIWDTLAPPTTSQASIICHDGGARSVSVFDNDIGSGSVSPLIVTGGKFGDVGIHDFRYIATGKTKRQNNSTENGKAGEHNLNGMVWYIPKAHSGSVTKIATIPNTSFFLTGSKDGDVKLWDAKQARMVFHWPKLHEKHTFLQPSSRGFGGVVREAVTDIKVVSNGFLSCGGDGSVRMVELKNQRR